MIKPILKQLSKNFVVYNNDSSKLFLYQNSSDLVKMQEILWMI